LARSAVLVIAADIKNISKAYRFVEEAAQAFGAGPEAIFHLRLAVEEVVANIIIHGYQGRSGEVEIELEQQGGAVIVRLRDQAPPFDPTTVPPPDLSLPFEQQTPEGRGVFLIRQIMDQVTYRLSPTGGNELTLIKRG
jgi:serine/threonine-protein kinase RsbW